MSQVSTGVPAADAGPAAAGLAALPVLLVLGAILPEFAPLHAPQASAPGRALERLLSLLPLGPLPLRVALTSALLAAGGAALLQRALSTLLAVRGLAADRALPLSVASSWAVAGSGALLAMQHDTSLLPLLLALACLERLSAQVARGPTLAMVDLALASLLLGLLWAVEPWLALALSLPWLVVAERSLRAQGRSALHLSPLLVGAPGALLPLVIGDGNGPAAALEPPGLVALGLSVVGVGAGVVLAARDAQRRLFALWLLGALAGLVPAALGLGASGPAALRLLPCAAGVMLAALVAALLPAQGRSGLLQLATVALAALGLLSLREALLEDRPAQPAVSDHWTDGVLRQLPARAVLIASDAGARRLQHLWELEGGRPDVVTVPLATLSDPARADRFARAQPALKGLLRTHLIDGRLSPFELQSLAATRPVLVEPAPHAAPEAQELDESLLPEGAYHRVQTSSVTGTDVRAATAHQRAHYQALHDRIALSTLPHDARTLMRDHHLADALYFLRADERRGATEALERALAVDQDNARAQRLLTAIEQLDKKEKLDGDALLREVEGTGR